MFNDHSRILIDRLQYYCHGNDYNILSILIESILGLSCETMLGTKLSADQTRKCYLEVKEFSKKYSKASNYMMLYIALKHLLGIEIESKQEQALSTVKQILKDREEEFHKSLKLSSENNILTDNFIDRVIQYKHNDLSNEFSAEQHLMFGIMAVLDTSALTIANTILLLAMHPEIQEKCYNEIINVTGKDNADISVEQLSGLDYLSMTTKEILRLMPSVPFIGRKLGCDIETGYYISYYLSN